MSRYIDADAIQIPKTHADAFENCRNCELLDADQVREIIDTAPSIDIVRCKECKHGEYRDDFNDYKCHSSGCGLVYDENFFCADGERRES